MRVKDRLSVHGLFSTGATTGLSQILKRENFSSVDRLFAVTNLVVRFCKILLSKIRSDGATSDNIKNATAEELWILERQRIVVADMNFKQWKKQLDLFQDEKGVGGEFKMLQFPIQPCTLCFFPEAIISPSWLSRRPTFEFFITGSGRCWQSCAQATGLSRAEALSKVFFNIFVCAEDTKGNLTVHHRPSTSHFSCYRSASIFLHWG